MRLYIDAGSPSRPLPADFVKTCKSLDSTLLHADFIIIFYLMACVEQAPVSATAVGPSRVILPSTKPSDDQPTLLRHDSVHNSCVTEISKSTTAVSPEGNHLDHLPHLKHDNFLLPVLKITCSLDLTEPPESGSTSCDDDVSSLDLPRSPRPGSLIIPSFTVTSPSEASSPATSRIELPLPSTAYLSPLRSNPPLQRLDRSSSATPPPPPVDNTPELKRRFTFFKSHGRSPSTDPKAQRRSTLLIPLPVLEALSALTARSSPHETRFRPTYSRRFDVSLRPGVKRTTSTSAKRAPVVSGVFYMPRPKGGDMPPAPTGGRPRYAKADAEKKPDCKACADTRWVVARCTTCLGRGRDCAVCKGRGDRWIECWC